MSQLRVGVVGCGGIAQMMHLPTLAERPDRFRIVGLADLSRPALAAVAERYRVPFTTTDARALVVHPEVEAILLLTSGAHRDLALAALRAGKHLFVEKPLGFSLAETEEIARAARTNRRLLMVGYHKRFDPAYRRARELVRGMRDLRFVEVTVLHPDDGAYRTHHALLPVRRRRPSSEAALDEAAAREATEGTLAAPIARAAGKGSSGAVRVATSMLFQSLIHDVNVLRGILGEPERVVSGHVWRGGLAQTSLTRFAGNLRVALSWISLPGLKHYEETLRFVSPEKRVTLTFPSPYLRHAPTPLTVEHMDGEELVVEHRTVSYEEAFRLELHHFRDCVRRGKAPAVGVADALGDARWIEAIARELARSERASAPSRRRSPS